MFQACPHACAFLSNDYLPATFDFCMPIVRTIGVIAVALVQGKYKNLSPNARMRASQDDTRNGYSMPSTRMHPTALGYSIAIACILRTTSDMNSASFPGV